MDNFCEETEMSTKKPTEEEKEIKFKATKVSIMEIEKICADNEVANFSFTNFLKFFPEYLIPEDEDEDFKDLFTLYYLIKLDMSESNLFDEEVDVTVENTKDSNIADDNVSEEFDINAVPTLDDISEALKSRYKLNENNYNMTDYVNHIKNSNNENCLEREEVNVSYLQSGEELQEVTDPLTSLLGGKKYFNKNKNMIKLM